MPKVTIGCRLPHGLIVRHPNPEISIEYKLNGAFSSKLFKADGSPASSFGITEVDADFWEVWKRAYHDYKPLKNGVIFEAKTPQEAKSKADELVKEKTGFEPVAQDTGGVKKADQ